MSPHALILRRGLLQVIIDTALDNPQIVIINITYDGLELRSIQVGLHALTEFVRLLNANKENS